MVCLGFRRGSRLHYALAWHGWFGCWLSLLGSSLLEAAEAVTLIGSTNATGNISRSAELATETGIKHKKVLPEYIFFEADLVIHILAVFHE